LCVISSSDARSVQQICQSTLHDFNLCMFRQDSEQHPSLPAQCADDKPNRLSNEMVFKIIIICLAMIHVMQKDGQFSPSSPLEGSVVQFGHRHTVFVFFWIIFSFILYKPVHLSSFGVAVKYVNIV